MREGFVNQLRKRPYWRQKWDDDDVVYNLAVYLDTECGAGSKKAAKASLAFDRGRICLDSVLTPELLILAPRARPRQGGIRPAAGNGQVSLRPASQRQRPAGLARHRPGQRLRRSVSTNPGPVPSAEAAQVFRESNRTAHPSRPCATARSSTASRTNSRPELDHFAAFLPVDRLEESCRRSTARSARSRPRRPQPQR